MYVSYYIRAHIRQTINILLKAYKAFVKFGTQQQ